MSDPPTATATGTIRRLAAALAAGYTALIITRVLRHPPTPHTAVYKEPRTATPIPGPNPTDLYQQRYWTTDEEVY